MDSEQQLLAAAQRGDREAMGKLLEKHQARVYRFGMRMCGAEEDAKDVLQETLLAAARTLPDFRGASSLSTWLYTIARSFCIKQRRRSKFAPEAMESLDSGEPARAVIQLPDPARGPEEALEGQRLEATLEEAIGALEPKYREVLVLRDVEGLSATEVGEVLGLSVEAVKSRLHRARMAVRERVAPTLLGELAAQTAPTPDCRDVVETFSRRLEGEIDSNVCAELESHLQTCTSCRGRCDSLRATLTLCKEAAQQPVPASVESSVRAALRRFLAERA